MTAQAKESNEPPANEATAPDIAPLKSVLTKFALLLPVAKGDELAKALAIAANDGLHPWASELEGAVRRILDMRNSDDQETP